MEFNEDRWFAFEGSRGGAQQEGINSLMVNVPADVMQVSSVVSEAFPERVTAGLEAGKGSPARGTAQVVPNPGRLLPSEGDLGAVRYF